MDFTFAGVRAGLRPASHERANIVVAMLAAVCLCIGTSAVAADSTDVSSTSTSSNGPFRLSAQTSAQQDLSTGQRNADSERRTISGRPARYEPGEFELYVNKLLGVDVQPYTTVQRMPAETTASGEVREPRPQLIVRRLGADLMLDGRDGMADGPRAVGEDYVLGIGDEVQITLWGSVDADLRLVVDRLGRINVPRVGPIMVAGVRYGQLNDVVQSRVAQTFKNFQVTTALGRLRSFRIYVTGYTQHPGPYTVSSLSTVVTGLMQAGGPSAAGSFRNVELRRSGKTIAHFDAYDLLLRGDKSTDVPLQAEDVLYIGQVGAQAAVLGSVNKTSIIELKAGETVADAINMAGGFSAVADRSRISVERLSDRNDKRVVQLDLPAQSGAPVSNGDVLRAFSAVDAELAQDRQYKRVRVEGEVLRPGDYLLPPASTLQDALQAAGGLTPQAYVFGTDFSRESVRKVQQDNYDRALRDMETDFTRTTSTQRALTADEAATQAQRATGASRLIERLRTVRPTGRIVLQLDPAGSTLPQLVVEDGDRLTVPPRPTTVGVFGSVFNAGSYLLTRGSTLNDVMKLAGGAKKGADEGSVFVLRANGSVVSSRQTDSGWLSMGSGINNLPALPGDTIFVPEELDKTTFAQSAQQWTQILYQFGLGAAALKTIRN
ncbi:SLBB domain-containing protein [Paucibacter sp. R3-3]|uniref:SLBB domain-containing protein n=1 Tax=Roseateles agri TaxID=3098619 RepID=A0ABU5DD98_9BURK|nr:SLBB domain-containing protein [Paucibacter sp. R3-3]MDY0744253.1 SLBB domain-containing protein [Paucibacter sp. R3-3]